MYDSRYRNLNGFTNKTDDYGFMEYSQSLPYRQQENGPGKRKRQAKYMSSTSRPLDSSCSCKCNILLRVMSSINVFVIYSGSGCGAHTFHPENECDEITALPSSALDTTVVVRDHLAGTPVSWRIRKTILQKIIWILQTI